MGLYFRYDIREKRSLGEEGGASVDTGPDGVYTATATAAEGGAGAVGDNGGRGGVGSKRITYTPRVRDNNQISHEERDEVLNTSSATGPSGEDDLDTTLSYGHLMAMLLMQVDESVLVFLIVMLICGIVYSCKSLDPTRTSDLRPWGLICLYLLTVLLCILSKPAMNEIFLVLVSYVILGTFLAIEVAVSFAMQPRLVFLLLF